MSFKSCYKYYLGLGSNVGHRSFNLTQSVQHIKSFAKIKQTSFLYESQPMYYTNQSPFLNAAIHIESSLNPSNLLKQLKNIEKNIMKREENFKNGPRIIDIDILCAFENSKEIYFTNTENNLHSTDNSHPLQIPHLGISERNFVLTPLADLLPNYKPHTFNKTVSELSQILLHKDTTSHNLLQVLPLKIRNCKNELFHYIDNSDHSLQHKTLLMAILNITPDSFSDGGKWNNIDEILKYIENEIYINKTDINIIDIGGQSTRPNSDRLNTAQELERIVPVLEGIKTHFSDIEIPISIDTYNSEVAKECVLNGYGDIINDVSGGTMDNNMYDIVSELGVPYICMHMRGDPSTMQKQYNLEYGNNMIEFMDMLNKELYERVYKAQECGIAAWNIILDPGVGFAKTSEQNQYLLNNMYRVRNDKKYAVLSGCSRKSYLNQILGEEISKKGADSMEKIIGTQSGVTASILSGANIIRVHDLYMMDIARRVTDSIYNVNYGRNVLRADDGLLK
eukprot:475294_1